jgi:hypothetical protein
MFVLLTFGILGAMFLAGLVVRVGMDCCCRRDMDSFLGRHSYT